MVIAAPLARVGQRRHRFDVGGGVDRRRGLVHMAQQLSDLCHRRPGVQRLGRERATQRVWSDTRHACCAQAR